MKIISGGQTGVDRAALDVALELGLPIGGWCPAGRRAEDGRIPDHYPLRETRSSDSSERTRRNVEEADATLILYVRAIDEAHSRGTHLTYVLAVREAKKVLTADLEHAGVMVPVARSWIEPFRSHGVINIAGPRESQSPGIYEKAREFLRQVLA